MNYPLIAKLVASYQVVAVGESTHGTHELFEFKAKLFRELVRKHGFNSFLLEDSVGACERLNMFIASGSGDLDNLMGGLYPVWQVEELKTLIEWLKDNHEEYPVEFIGFDINQTAENLKKRDELMAKNIYDYTKANTKAKALVWAHNTHVKYAGHTENEKPMGMFLQKWLGRDYFAIGQFFGRGTFSATIIDEKNPDWSNRKLSPIQVKNIPSDFLEAKLDKIGGRPYYLSDIGMAAFKDLDDIYPARSLGWGLVPDKLDEIVEELNPTKDFGLLTYFPEATHSLPLPQ